MDLLDFSAEALYYEEAMAPEVAASIQAAARSYADGGGEDILLRALAMQPESLPVLVALYRFYYYRHRLEDAWQVAQKALAVAGGRLNLPRDWRDIGDEQLGRAAQCSMTLLRFYLLALKAAGYLRLRLGDEDLGVAMLEKLAQLDQQDRLGAGVLLQVVRQARSA